MWRCTTLLWVILWFSSPLDSSRLHGHRCSSASCVDVAGSSHPCAAVGGEGGGNGGGRGCCRWLIKVETTGSANMTKEKEAALYSGLLITLKPLEFTFCQAAALVHCWQTAATFFITLPNGKWERNSYVCLQRSVVIYTIYTSNREDGLNDVPK